MPDLLKKQSGSFFVRVCTFLSQKIPCMKQRDPFDQAEIAKREEIEFERQRAIERTRLLLKNVMRDKDGRELVFFMLDLSQCDTPSFNTNALTMAFNEGRRSYGLDLKRLIDPELYQLMLKESYERTRNKRSSRNEK